MCGEVKSKEKEKTASTPLVTVSDLQRLNKFEIIVLRRRMFPYKTRFQTDFEVDWGRTYPKSVPPARQKKELELFDIREFVKEKKKEKMEAMGGNPFPGATGATPFGAPNPFMGMSNPFSGGLPPFMSANDSSEDSDTSFNIDDLVKKIDAKIAEIEKEEEQTKEVEEKKNSPFEELVSNKTNQVVDVPSEEVHKEVPTAPAVEQTPTNVEQTPVKTETISNMYQDNTNDDDFFDDFFSDD
jgi:phage terminase Nu1 subunit (DNA packaging protein)